MADPFNCNDSTVSTNLERGWRDRQNKAQSRANDTADWREVDRIRQAHFAELNRKALEEAVARHAKHTARISCPCCDAGTVTVEFAERLIHALAVLPANAQPDANVIAKLLAIAAGRPPNEPLSLHPSLNLHAPRKAEAVALAPVAQPQILPAVTENAPEEAAALAAIQANLTQPVKSAKPVRKHIAPPFLEDDA